MSKMQEELRERAASYRLGGPSSEHTALMLEAAAAKIDYLEALLDLERDLHEQAKVALSNSERTDG